MYLSTCERLYAHVSIGFCKMMNQYKYKIMSKVLISHYDVSKQLSHVFTCSILARQLDCWGSERLIIPLEELQSQCDRTNQHPLTGRRQPLGLGYCWDKTRSCRKLVNRGGDFMVRCSFIRTWQYSLVKRKSKYCTLQAFFSLFPNSFGKIKRVATYVSHLPPSERLALLLHIASKGGERGNLTFKAGRFKREKLEVCFITIQGFFFF